MRAEIPSEEPARIAALRRYQVLDTAAEPAFDDITRIAAYVTKTPIALISLVDADRQWFKSKLGLGVPETPRDLAFCAHAILNPGETLVVPDATRDHRFADNPLVTGEPDIRFYAGVPLMTPDRQALGTLCVIDRVPRELTDEQQSALEALSRLVVAQLEQGRQRTQLQVLTDRFQLAATAAGIGIWDWDVTNNVLIWDDTMHALYGTSPNGFGNAYEAWRSAVHPDDLAMAEGSINSALQGIHDFTPTFRITAQDGTVKHIRAAALVVRSHAGTATRMIGVNWDVTAERLAEERFQMVVEAAPSAMLMADASRAITLVNRKTEELFGYTRDELLGQPIELLVPERLRAQHAGHVAGFFANPDARAMGVGRELFGRCKDGTEVPIEIGLNPIATPDGLFTLASIIEITERKRVEDELRRSNADLEQFAYIASHDLQEPLRMVASYTELLGQRYRGQLDEKADKYIHYATDGARRMQGLIADLLQYSRIGSQGKPLVPVAADAVMQRVLGTLSRQFADAGGTVDVGPLPMVYADESQLSQLFQNLVANAVKFRGANPPRVEVAAVRNGGYWTFSVKDNGIGMDMKYADRVFQMFQRLHERGRYEGSGIGLSVAKRIVERHGGRIWLESAPDAGTTFFFTVPVFGLRGRA